MSLRERFLSTYIEIKIDGLMLVVIIWARLKKLLESGQGFEDLTSWPMCFGLVSDTPFTFLTRKKGQNINTFYFYIIKLISSIDAISFRNRNRGTA